MKFAINWLVAFGLLAMSGGAFAQDYDGSGTGYGTDDNTNAGVVVQNVATVTYEVGGVVQETTQNDPTQAQFRVDRVILLNVTKTADALAVSPGAQDQYVTFTVTNDSNATLDLILDFDQSGGTFDVSNVTLWRESEAIPDGFDSNTDTQITFPVGAAGYVLADMDEEETATIYVVGNIPAASAIADPDDGADDQVILLATAYNNVPASPLPADIVVETDPDSLTANEADPMFLDTVFGDLAGTWDVGGADEDVAQDGKHSATASFVVGSASVTVTKSSVVLNDPFNGTTNPKAIPGAEVLYCIVVTNSGGTDATNVSIKDPIPTGTTYVNESIRVFNTPVTCAPGLELTGTVISDSDTDDATEPATASGFSGNSGDSTAPTSEATDTVVNTTADTVDAKDGATDGVTATIFRVTID